MIHMIRSFLPLLVSALVVFLALEAGFFGRAVAVLAGLVTYIVAFLALVTNNGEGDKESNAWVWLANAFALGGVFLVGLSSLADN